MGYNSSPRGVRIIKKTISIKKFASMAISFVLAALLVFAVLPAGVASASSNISVSISGAPVDFPDQRPAVIAGRTMVPVRGVFMQLGFDVHWDASALRATFTKDDCTIVITIGSYVFTTDGVEHFLDVPAMLINGRTMVPLRLPLETVGYEVDWNPASQVVAIRPSVPLFVEFGGLRFTTGDSLESVREALGMADRIEPSSSDYLWHVYNGDYRRFIMVGVRSGRVVALYTNSRGFVTNNAAYGLARGSVTASLRGVQLYFDNNSVCAVLVTAPNVAPRRSFDAAYFRAQELQCFDAANAFRANHGVGPLLWDDVAASAARGHSQDMANRNFFSHNCPNGSTPTSRYSRAGGRGSVGENILAGRSTGVDALDFWVNSSNHRSNLLRATYHSLGVGFGHNQGSRYVFYATQKFIG